METELNPTRAKANGDMPYDEKAEQSVISAMMMSDDALQDGLMDLSADDFFMPRHRTLFSTMNRMFEEGQKVDPVSLADALRSDGELDKCGGMTYLMDLMGSPLNLISWQNHAGIVRRDATYRRMIVASTQITAMAYEAPEDEREVVDGAERLLLAVTDRSVRSSYTPIADVMSELYEELSTDDGKPRRVVRTGFPGIDKATMGLRGGQMVVVGARPGVGKTSLCLNMAVNAANQGVTVALFSLEMSKMEIAQRLLSSTSGIPLTDIRAGKIKQDLWASVIDATEEVSKLDILIDDTPGTTVTEIRAKARRMLHNKESGIVIIDYLQLLSASAGGNRSDSRATQVGEMSRGIKIMAKDLDVPVMALSQLNRTVEGRTGKRPQLSDLRESGAIEQDADIVILLDRSMTPEEAEKADRPDEGVTDFILAKNRSGPLTTIHTRFQGDTIRFMELDGGKYE